MNANWANTPAPAHNAVTTLLARMLVLVLQAVALATP